MTQQGDALSRDGGTSLHPLFGVEVKVADVNACTPGQAAKIERLVGLVGLILIRNVAVDAAGLARFAGAFGVLQNLGQSQAGVPGIFRLSNLSDDGRVKSPSDVNRLRHEANKLWHTDSSFMLPGARYSFLHALVVPESGKDTLFCDGRVAWEALDCAHQRRLLPLTAHHAMAHSWRLTGITLPETASGPLVRRKLVRWHAPSRRHALVIPSHVERIIGRSYEESQDTIVTLAAVAAAPERVYRHHWQAGDLLIWDNRCMLHRASRSGAEDQPRLFSTCRTIDENDEGLAEES
jgi:alpha-ketoglutarate-dependent 2,4-dichlorophenoxyacetate dioxygenase